LILLLNIINSFILLKQICYFLDTLLTLTQKLNTFLLLSLSIFLYQKLASFHLITMLKSKSSQIHSKLSLSLLLFFCQLYLYIRSNIRKFWKHWSVEICPAVISLNMLLRINFCISSFQLVDIPASLQFNRDHSYMLTIGLLLITFCLFNFFKLLCPFHYL
jgi:hypothetical protein